MANKYNKYIPHIEPCGPVRWGGACVKDDDEEEEEEEEFYY